MCAQNHRAGIPIIPKSCPISKSQPLPSSWINRKLIRCPSDIRWVSVQIPPDFRRISAGYPLMSVGFPLNVRRMCAKWPDIQQTIRWTSGSNLASFRSILGLEFGNRTGLPAACRKVYPHTRFRIRLHDFFQYQILKKTDPDPDISVLKIFHLFLIRNCCLLFFLRFLVIIFLLLINYF